VGETCTESFEKKNVEIGNQTEAKPFRKEQVAPFKDGKLGKMRKLFFDGFLSSFGICSKIIYHLDILAHAIHPWPNNSGPYPLACPL